MKKRLCAFMLAAAMVFSVCGCSLGNTESTYTTYETEEIINSDSGVSGSNFQSGNSSDSGGSSQSIQPTVSKPSKGSSTAIDTSGKKVELANPVYIAEGTKSMDEGLDFKGKTFTMAARDDSAYTTSHFKRLVAAFEKKYNCKIDMKNISFSNYATILSNAKASGKPYDIIFCHGSRFPEIPLSGVVNDLSGYLTTADYDTGKGGIDIAKSSYFVLDDKLYGVVGGEDAVYPCVIYYNKLMFKKNGLEDPYELYKAGKWTWSKLREQGQKVTDESKNIYYADYYFIDLSVVHSFGTSIMTWKNNKVVNNLNDTNVIKGYQLIYDLFNKSKICYPDQTSAQEYKLFTDGIVFCLIQESQKYSAICENAAGSAAFNRDYKNVGIVPIPQDSASAKRGYPCGWYGAVMSGGSDPRVAVAFAKFWSTFEDATKDKYELSDKYKSLIDKLTSGNITNLHGGYTGSDGVASYTYLKYPIAQDIGLGRDVSSAISATLPKINAAVEYVIKK